MWSWLQSHCAIDNESPSVSYDDDSKCPVYHMRNSSVVIVSWFSSMIIFSWRICNNVLSPQQPMKNPVDLQVLVPSHTVKVGMQKLAEKRQSVQWMRGWIANNNKMKALFHLSAGTLLHFVRVEIHDRLLMWIQDGCCLAHSKGILAQYHWTGGLLWQPLRTGRGSGVWKNQNTKWGINGTVWFS